MDRMARRDHWESVYTRRPPDEVSWHQDTPESSLALLEHAGASPESAIIDVGGGASRLVDHLLERGYENVTVLDVSARALELAQQRLGPRAEDVRWIVGDITQVELPETYEIWHDRAVFHFLTEPDERARYRQLLTTSIVEHGHVLIATFALDGPEHCSGLPVVRYAPEDLGRELGPAFELVETWNEPHVTPAGKTQEFVFCRFRHTGD